MYEEVPSIPPCYEIRNHETSGSRDPETGDDMEEAGSVIVCGQSDYMVLVLSYCTASPSHTQAPNTRPYEYLRINGIWVKYIVTVTVARRRPIGLLYRHSIVFPSAVGVEQGAGRGCSAVVRVGK